MSLSSRLVWAVLCIVAGSVALIYLSLGLVVSEESLVMPLDDTYIHFQYARQMAEGAPYIYNPGDDATSGATSFLYTPVLAVGHLVGFRGLDLGYWAAAVGWLCLIGSGWLIYRLTLRLLPQPHLHHYIVAALLMLAFVIAGPVAWAAFSGMETLLFVLMVLLALDSYVSRDTVYMALAGTLAAVTRPEGAVVALTLAFAAMIRRRQFNVWLGLPVVAVGVQPAVNWVVTGTFSASGNQAKSHLYNVTVSLSGRIETSLEFWERLWRELISGRSPVDGRYIPSIMVLLALLAVVLGMRESWRRREVTPALLAGSWLLGMSILIATLDTAFWHFKRYQLPLMGLMFPLAGWALMWFEAQLNMKSLTLGVAAVVVMVSSWTTLEYARRYRDNIFVVQNQQIPMARWVDANLPGEARVGVHDVGVMRYVGRRATYDLVGLTTDDNTAMAWRQGSGAIYEVMQGHKHRPDYFAIYHDIQSLPLLEQAGVFGNVLADFGVELPENTVASATATQIVSRADWSSAFARHQPHLYVPAAADLLLTVDVGDLASEAEVSYRWWNDDPLAGFATVVRQLSYASCVVEPCSGTDGGRIINGGEEFDLPADGNLVVMRVHAANYARLKIGCDEVEDVQIVPARPGEWVDIVTPTAGDRFCVEAEGEYRPFTYWVYDVDFEAAEPPTQTMATFVDPFDQREIELVTADYEIAGTSLLVDITWHSQGDLQHDGKLFIHLYDDPDRPPVHQLVVWPGGDVLPPANWLPGELHETYVLQDLTPGHYIIALGLYEPNIQRRYTVGEGDRLFLGEVDIRG